MYVLATAGGCVGCHHKSPVPHPRFSLLHETATARVQCRRWRRTFGRSRCTCRRLGRGRYGTACWRCRWRRRRSKRITCLIAADRGFEHGVFDTLDGVDLEVNRITRNCDPVEGAIRHAEWQHGLQSSRPSASNYIEIQFAAIPDQIAERGVVAPIQPGEHLGARYKRHAPRLCRGNYRRGSYRALAGHIGC